MWKQQPNDIQHSHTFSVDKCQEYQEKHFKYSERQENYIYKYINKYSFNTDTALAYDSTNNIHIMVKHWQL